MLQNIKNIIFKNTKSRISFLIFFLLVLDLLSYISFFNLGLLKVSFIIITLSSFVLALYKLEYGLLILFLELLIGSKGYLFYYPLDGRMIPLRMVLWALVMLIFVFILLKQLIVARKSSGYYQKIIHFPYLKYYILLGVFVFIGLINGYLRGHSYANIFFDFNAFLYLLLIFPAIVVYTSNNDDIAAKVFNNLKIIFLAGAIYLSVKTLVLLYIFTHNLYCAADVYSWLRKTLIGEMTPTLGGWPRIFIQSQIYPIIAYLFISFQEGVRRTNVMLAALFLSAALISFSRSFWFASAR
jgi:hypothetical protein